MRIAQVIRLDPDRIEEYEHVHAAVWSEVLAQLSDPSLRDAAVRELRVRR